MMKKVITMILAVVMTCVCAFSTNVVAFAAESPQISAEKEITEPTRATLLTSGSFSGYQGSSGNFYVSGGAVKAFYLTMSGDSNNYVNFTVYRGTGTSNPVWEGAFLANGEMHYNVFIYLQSGNYHIDFNTASSNTIIYAMSWNG